MRARLETGRTHQIRVHLAFIGHPIVGDPVYGPRATREARALGLARQFLHATRLGFNLPAGAWRAFDSPCRRTWRRAGYAAIGAWVGLEP